MTTDPAGLRPWDLRPWDLRPWGLVLMDGTTAEPEPEPDE